MLFAEGRAPKQIPGDEDISPVSNFTEGKAMLVLSRKPGQKLQIGDNVTITVLEVHGGVIRLGVDDHNDVRVLRGELQDWKDQPKATPKGRALALAS